MFLNTNILKRLMKQAYKEGLKVARTEERLYIAGSYWEMDVLEEFLPNAVLGLLYELAGKLPEVGKRFSVTKDDLQEENGYRLEVSEDGFQTSIRVTPLILLGYVPQRILQEPGTGVIHLVNNVFIAIADNSCIDKDRGETPAGSAPFFSRTGGILWENNTTRFHALWRQDEANGALLNELSALDLADPAEK